MKWLAVLALSSLLLVLTLAEPTKDDSSGEPESICVSAVQVEMGEGLEDLFELASNPLDDLSLPPGRPYRIKLELAELSGHNAFRTVIGPGGGQIIGSDRAAVLYGVDAVASKISENRCQLPLGDSTEQAALEIRALHFSLKRLPLDVARSMIDRARSARFNTVIMHIADAVEIRPDIVLPRQDALSTEEFRELVAYARANGLNVIPGLALLTHQRGFFNERYPELMYNYATYDPRNPRVYELVFEYLEELIDVMGPTDILIGHDEVKGLTGASRRKWLKEGERALPPELFLMDVVKLNDFLSGKKIRAWMWGDMLIDRAEFPSMHKKNFHGTHGYKDLRGQIPKDVLIIDWHYHHETPDFPSAKAFADEGYAVVGSSWKKPKNIELFAEYMSSLGGNGKGMVATTFYHVQRREWELVDSIINESGKHYWEAGR